MFYLCGSGLAGVNTGQALVHLPTEARRNLVGSSAGALAVAGLAGGDLEGLSRLVESTGWPASSTKLKRALEEWCRRQVGSDEGDPPPSFRQWAESTLEDFACFAYDCLKGHPVLFSPLATPDASVAEVLTAAASWPPAVPSGVAVGGRAHCDAEYVVSPFLLHRFLRPSRVVIIRGTSRSFAEACAPHAGLSWMCRIAELHGRLMDTLSSSCSSFVAKLPGPGPLEAVLCHRSHPRPPSVLLPTIWLLIAMYGRLLASEPPRLCRRQRRQRKQVIPRW